MDEITEKEEDLLDVLGSGVEEFKEEGDFATEATKDCDSEALDELTTKLSPSTNYYDLLLEVSNA
jgi:hypothetical protein